MLLRSLYGHKLQFNSHKLHPFSSSHGQLRELVFFSHTEALIFFKCHTRLFAEPVISALLFASLVTTVLVQLLNKMHLKYIFHDRFRMIMPISWKEKTLSSKAVADVFQNKCSLKFCSSLGKPPVLELLFN